MGNVMCVCVHMRLTCTVYVPLYLAYPIPGWYLIQQEHACVSSVELNKSLCLRSIPGLWGAAERSKGFQRIAGREQVVLMSGRNEQTRQG